jgi:hypothetical protein
MTDYELTLRRLAVSDDRLVASLLAQTEHAMGGAAPRRFQDDERFLSGLAEPRLLLTTRGLSDDE